MTAEASVGGSPAAAGHVVGVRHPDHAVGWGPRRRRSHRLEVDVDEVVGEAPGSPHMNTTPRSLDDLARAGADACGRLGEADLRPAAWRNGTSISSRADLVLGPSGGRLLRTPRLFGGHLRRPHGRPEPRHDPSSRRSAGDSTTTSAPSARISSARPVPASDRPPPVPRGCALSGPGDVRPRCSPGGPGAASRPPPCVAGRRSPSTTLGGGASRRVVSRRSTPSGMSYERGRTDPSRVAHGPGTGGRRAPRHGRCPARRRTSARRGERRPRVGGAAAAAGPARGSPVAGTRTRPPGAAGWRPRTRRTPARRRSAAARRCPGRRRRPPGPPAVSLRTASVVASASGRAPRRGVASPNDGRLVRGQPDVGQRELVRASTR